MTTQNNILIAKFMGWRIDNSFPDKDKVYRKGGRLELDTTFKYHKSWDWLMPVVEAIEALDPDDRVNCTYSVDITNRGTDIQPSIWGGNDRFLIRHNCYDRRLMNTYDAIVEFLKRYEELKKNEKH
jgi:hypothetical protein